MSSQYTTEPPPTATVLLQTTAGPLTISLFASQTPLTTRNFLQHCLDGTYNNTIFHRVSPGFVIQTGDPTGTGEGGVNIYEDGDKNLERYGETWGRVLRLPEERFDERIVLGDETHSRLKFNRRGLIGMARMIDSKEGQGQYGSQWFITLGDCRAELDGKCTMIGRIEGDGIYNVMKIANGELLEGTERPIYPEKVTSVKVLEMPESEVWQSIRRREKVAARTVDEDGKSKKKEKAVKKKGGKALLSFGGDAGDEDEGVGVAVRPKKAKFNTALIDGPTKEEHKPTNGKNRPSDKSTSRKRKSPEPALARPISEPEPEPEPKRRKPSFHEPTTQLPIQNPESPSRSPTPPVVTLPNQRHPSTQKSASALESEIAALKATMKRSTAPAPESKKKLSALEALIPTTSTRGRKRPRPGHHAPDEPSSTSTTSTLKLLNAFKARLEGTQPSNTPNPNPTSTSTAPPTPNAPDIDTEATLCDLHFIAHCQSCSNWANPNTDGDGTQPADANETRDTSFLTHALTFERDRLGKDLTWKQKNEEELVVIDPREREREMGLGREAKRKGGRERDWDRDRRREKIS